MNKASNHFDSQINSKVFSTIKNKAASIMLIENYIICKL